jgi:BirA family biotin operon repressor/biotin-[acetyl-CoA-carboxylase] ligase
VAAPFDLFSVLVSGPLRGVEWHRELASTNTTARVAAARGEPELHLVLADRQRAGRGRAGRSWTAEAGASLLLSLVVRPALPVVRWSLLPLLTGVALVDAVDGHVGDAGLKWPNDLLVGGRKAAGILVETAQDAAVVGVGVNVDWRGVQRPPELLASTSLAEAAGRSVDAHALLHAFVSCFAARYASWAREPAGFLDDYRRRCVTLGRAVRVTRLAAPPLQGTAVGVHDDGALAVRDADGEVALVHAGDVEHVRPR